MDRTKPDGWPIDRAVKAARERRGWTREALAFHAGLSWSAIAEIESGRRSALRPATLTALATALDVSVDYLLGRASSPGSTPQLQHEVLFYATTDEFVAGVLPCVVEGLARGDPVLAVTSPAIGAALRRDCPQDPGRVRFADASSWYESLDGALDAYRSFLDETVGGGASRVRVVASPDWTTMAVSGDAWNRYEALVNFALATEPAEIICGYDTMTAPDDVIAGARETHPEVLDAVGVATGVPGYAPFDVLMRPGPTANG